MGIDLVVDYACSATSSVSRAEEVAEHGHRVPLDILEEDGRAIRLCESVEKIRHIVFRRDGFADAQKFAAPIEAVKGFAQIAVYHRSPNPIDRLELSRGTLLTEFRMLTAPSDLVRSGRPTSRI